jgi:hypothetical protein
MIVQFSKDYWANTVDHLIHNIPEGLKDCFDKIYIKNLKFSIILDISLCIACNSGFL